MFLNFFLRLYGNGGEGNASEEIFKFALSASWPQQILHFFFWIFMVYFLFLIFSGFGLNFCSLNSQSFLNVFPYLKNIVMLSHTTNLHFVISTFYNFRIY